MIHIVNHHTLAAPGAAGACLQLQVERGRAGAENTKRTARGAPHAALHPGPAIPSFRFHSRWLHRHHRDRPKKSPPFQFPFSSIALRRQILRRARRSCRMPRVPCRRKSPSPQAIRPSSAPSCMCREVDRRDPARANKRKRSRQEELIALNAVWRALLMHAFALVVIIACNFWLASCSPTAHCSAQLKHRCPFRSIPSLYTARVCV